VYYEETKTTDGSVVRRAPAVKRRLSNRGRQPEPMACVQVRCASNPPDAPAADDTFAADTMDSPPRLAAALTYDNLRRLQAGTPTAGRKEASASSTISSADKVLTHEERLAAALSRCNNRAWPSADPVGFGTPRKTIQDRLDSAMRRVRTPPSLRVDPLPPRNARRMLEKHS